MKKKYDVSDEFIEETERRILGLRVVRFNPSLREHIYARNFLWRAGFTEREFRAWCHEGHARNVWSVLTCVYHFLKASKEIWRAEGYKALPKKFRWGLRHIRSNQARWVQCGACGFCDFLDPGYMYRKRRNGRMYPGFVRRTTKFPEPAV